MPILDIVSKFNQQADSHSKSQSLNPFSDQFEQSRSPSPRFSREEYGKPVAGSKTDMRGRKAKSHICREILELCTVIHDVGTYNAKKRDPDDDDDDTGEDDGTIIVSFGELFQIYTKISDKVVGLLIAAKRRGFVYFDREILFQRRDDDVLIALLKPISEISKVLKDDIAQANAPAAAVTVELQPVEKKKSASSSKTKRTKSKETDDDKDTRKGTDDSGSGCRAISDSTVDNEVAKILADENVGHETNCNGKVNEGDLTEEVENNDINVSEDVQVDGAMTSVELTRPAIDVENETENTKVETKEIEDKIDCEGIADVIETESAGGNNVSDELDGKTEIEGIEGDGIKETEQIEEKIETEEDIKVDEGIKTENYIQTEKVITIEETEGMIEIEQIEDNIETKEIDDSGGIIENDHSNGVSQDSNNNGEDISDKNIKNDKLDEIRTICEADGQIQGDSVKEFGGNSPRRSIDNETEHHIISNDENK